MDASTYFVNRRTIRQYSKKEVDRKLLNDLLEAASHAPTTGNMQLYSVVVTCDEDNKKRLAPAHFNQPSVMSSSAVLTFCADINRFVRWSEERHAHAGFDNFQALIWAIEDAMIFAQQFVTLAEMNGLGTCYLGTTTYNAPQISEILGLPKRVVPIATVTVGYPEVDGVISDRLPIGAIIHDESYVDYDRNMIEDIYSYKENLADSKKFVLENDKETLAQVYTEVRYPRADNEHFSKVFAEFIRSKGFDI